MKNLLFTLYSSLLVISTLGAQVPGGVQDPGIWLHPVADSSGEVKVKEAVSGIIVNSDRPSEHAKFLNHNRVLPFSVSGYLQGIELDFEPKTIIVVARSEDMEERAIWGLSSSDTLRQLMTTMRIADMDQNKYMNYPRQPGSTAFLSTYFNKAQVKESAEISTVLSIGHPIRNDLPVAQFSGTIPEMLVYNRVLSREERNKVESCLAIRYGLTLQFFDTPQYVNSSGDIIWDALEQQEYGHRIAGIGRDDRSGLLQLRSTSSIEPGVLTIAFGKPVENSNTNIAAIENESFLVWGDNGAPMEIQQYQGEVGRIARAWYINSTGLSALHNTSVILNAAQLDPYISPKETVWLVIDRSGKGSSNLEATEYHPADYDENGIVFSNIKWDTDGSGGDNFHFEIGPEMRIIAEARHPRCNDRANGGIAIKCFGGKPPYVISVVGSERNVREKVLEGNILAIEDLPAGEYALIATDAEGKTSRTSVALFHSDLPKLDLETEYSIENSGTLKLDLRNTVYDRIDWIVDGKVLLTGKSVELADKGSYTVKAHKGNCHTVSEFRVVSVRPELISAFDIYPNPTINGYFQADITLEETTDITMRVFGPSGQLLDVENLNGRSHYQYQGFLGGPPGAYLINVRVNNTVITKSIVKQ